MPIQFLTPQSHKIAAASGECPCQRCTTWEAGHVLRLAACHTWSGAGLDYDAQHVTATERGHAGGWDVFEGVTRDGRKISFYGFSVLERVRL